MSDPLLIDKGGTPPDQDHENDVVQYQPTNSQDTSTYAKALGSTIGSMDSNIRNYSDIIAQHRKERNVIEIKLKKLKSVASNDSEDSYVKNLNFDQISELVFEVLKISFEDCVGADYYTGRYDTREIHLKSHIDSSKYITNEPISFMDHEVKVIKRYSEVVKVTFKNVPLSIPDEEILHLCGVYGAVSENKVYRDQLRITTSNKKGTLLSPTRYVFMKLNNGAQFKNYCWMEGPMAGDSGRRVTVLHTGQAQQCSHCFLNASTGCKGLGNGKACLQTGAPRAKMSTYMEAIKMETGYESLKNKYLRNRLRQAFRESIHIT